MAALQYLVYGERDGTLVHISDVPSGLACNCRCPECGGDLIARKGKIMAWHFAHASGQECATAPETALHKMAKAYLLQKRELCLPTVTVYKAYRKNPWNTYDEYDYGLYASYYADLCPECVVRATDMGMELSFGDVTPDVWLRDEGGRGWFMEIKVTHAVGDEKVGKLRKLGVPTLEADFSDFPRDLSADEFAKMAPAVFKAAKWVYHPVIDAFWKLDETEQYYWFMDIYQRGIKIPKNQKCSACGGRLNVIWSYLNDSWIGSCPVCGKIYRADKKDAVFYWTNRDERICPECGETMSKRKGRFGWFFGCDGWPDCSKTLPCR